MLKQYFSVIPVGIALARELTWSLTVLKSEVAMKIDVVGHSRFVLPFPWQSSKAAIIIYRLLPSDISEANSDWSCCCY